MIYEEKYTELHSKYQKSGKELELAIEKLVEINGFGDVIVNYKSKTKGEGTKFNTGSFSCWINQK
jgi:hypothetical protein